MALSVLVKSATNLPNFERFSKSDPMCVIIFEGVKKKTEVIKNDLDPEWNERLEWFLQVPLNHSEVMKVEVYDHETIGPNRLLGMLDLTLQDVVSKGRQSVSAPLKSMKGELMQSKINLELTYSAPNRGKERSEESIREEGGEGDSEEEGQGGGSDEDSEGEEREEGNQRRQQHSQKRRSATRAELPNKPLDFQVQVQFLEARNLDGLGQNPVVKVLCGRKVMMTSVQKGTNKPIWNEVLYFNFNEHPQEMFDRIMGIEVLNAKKVMRDAFIGSFEFNLGMVYNEADHCFIHKWLLLSDPSSAAGETKGYLKFSIQVLTPGDKPKPFPSEMSVESVDIESNLLYPPNVYLRPATMSIRIFRGEDFPQMDPGYFEGVKKFLRVGTVQKDLVDPFCTVTFAGHKGKTNVIWNEQDPEWNQQINLDFGFPSMCERIRFQVKDKDKSKDDFVGTCYLNIPQISAAGDGSSTSGFLPTFGPCFINIYGSTREFTDLPDKYELLNKGLLEGVAYRGRVMVEVDMAPGSHPTNRYEDIKLSDQQRIVPFLRRRKYKLFAAFFSATMIHPADATVYFEISIGNYGNKLDPNTPAQSSTTLPTNPVFDGNKYYFLSWMHQKPCALVDSQWEDCTYRIESLNLLNFTADSLEEDLKSVKKLLEGKEHDMDTVNGMMLEVLDNFIENLGEELPSLPDKNTRLDQQMRKHREQEWRILQEDVHHVRHNIIHYNLADVVAECEEYVQRLRCLAVEPQNCVPDVIIWMLSGSKRVAYKRIPSHLLMYSTNSKTRGKLCGKVQTVFLTPPAIEKAEELVDIKDGAQLRLMLWLGLEEYQTEMTKRAPEGELAVFAETYQNEACLLGKWGTMGVTRPRWSDSQGKTAQPLEAFEPPPPGWEWDGEWFISPDLSIAVEADEGAEEWVEDVFEVQLRQPLTLWKDSYWSDVHGDKLVEYDGKTEKQLTRDEIKPPEGWGWKTDWKIDSNRAVDEEGWEYAIEDGLGQWMPYEKNMHLCRRRRWVRLRKPVKDSKAIEKKKRKRQRALEEGWEYARLANLSYHLTEHRLDFARRRKWLRKLVAIDASKPAIFYMHKKKKVKKDDDEDETKLVVPRMNFMFREYHTYQLRAYLYQACDMCSSDTGFSDSYAVMAFHQRSVRSRVVKDSVWDQTLIIGNVGLFGSTYPNVLESPPHITIEFFKKHKYAQDEYIGKSEMTPTVRLSLDKPVPQLKWYKIEQYSKYVGELLAAFELFLDEGEELPFNPPTAPPPDSHYIVPSGIRPILQKTRIEVLCWGVRDMEPFDGYMVTSPLVKLEYGGTVYQSKPIKDASKNPNFPDPVITFDVYLPKEELYIPPLHIHIMDKRSYGRTPIIGTHSIKSLVDFFTDPTSMEVLLYKEMSLEDGKMSVVVGKQKDDPRFDWWSKYYYSIGNEQHTHPEYVEAGYDKLVVYPTELEESFTKFSNPIKTFPLFLDGRTVGYFKGMVKLYNLPDDGIPEPGRIFSHIPSSDPTDVVVRVYIVRGIDLQPQDTQCHPYLTVSVGKCTVDDRENHILDSVNPVFGKVFDLPATLPQDQTLTISVMHRGYSADDLIGKTTIDLENRFLSTYHATCGLSQSFAVQGLNRWRDYLLPTDILRELCVVKRLPNPQWSSDWKKVIFDGVEYTLDQFEGKKLNPDVGEPKQRLALYVLQQIGMVPEHIETRTIYNTIQPSISQGQLHMWVDIFPRNVSYVPPPIDIAPRKPEEYVLQVVVWKTKDVIMHEENPYTHDIYVKSWLNDHEDSQMTDVHYGVKSGECSFNWTFAFSFNYIIAGRVIITKKEGTKRYQSPNLVIQIWDNNHFGPGDYLGMIDLNLCVMPKPVSNPTDCSLNQLQDDREVKSCDLFLQKQTKGWWPVYNNVKGDKQFTGKIELEIQVLTKEEEKLRTAVKSKDDSNTSFIPKHGSDGTEMEVSQDNTESNVLASIDYRDLEFMNQLGEGGFGTVYRGRWKSRDKVVAIKRLNIIDERELDILGSIHHPNFIQLYGVVKQMLICCLVTELAECGSIYEYLHQKQMKPSLEQSLLWAKQIAEGMNYLHQRDIIHRDLKSSNVVLTSDLIAKICDLGSARILEHTARQTTVVGTYAWMAPEMMQRQEVSKECDVYSYSILLWEIITHKQPFSDVIPLMLPMAVIEGKRPPVPDCDVYLQQLMEQCWKTEPKERPSFKKILFILDRKDFKEQSAEENLGKM